MYEKFPLIRVLIDFQGRPNFNINCQDYQGYTALVLAIRNNNEEMVEYLSSFDDLILGDALLHAVHSGQSRITELMLNIQRWAQKYRTTNTNANTCIAQSVPLATSPIKAPFQ